MVSSLSLKEISKIALIVIVFSSCSRSDNFLNKEKCYRDKIKQDSALRNELFNNANDSILKWIDNRFEDIYYLSLTENKWKLDSFIVFNRDKNRAIGIVLEQLDEKSELDAIKYLNFEKKDSNWYFFLGATMVFPRKCYNKPSVQCKPIPMDTLRKEGRQYLLGSYYLKEWPWSEGYIINESWFKNEFEICWGEQSKRDWISGKSRKRLVDTTRIH